MAKLVLHTQYYQNYSDTNTPHWKPQGGHEFEIEGFDPDYLFYDEAAVLKTLTELVAKQSTDYEKFEYISHELKFGEPTEIKIADFNAIYGETINA